MEKNFIAVSFISENHEEVTFHAGTNQNAIDYTEEKVKIKKNLDGKYGEIDYVKILRWSKDNIHYELFVDSGPFSKEDVLKIAKSLYRIN